MKLSVSITAYNHEEFIAEALDGALMQKTDFDYEIIVGEDDSKDHTRQIVKSYKERYPDKIRLFLNDRSNVIYIDGKPTGRWNFVNNIKHARGEYVALLDGDDYWTDPQKLQLQADFLDEHPDVSLCFHPFKRIDQIEGNESIHYPPGRKQIYTLNDFLQTPFISCLSIVFRRSVIEDFPLWFYEMPQGDWPLIILCAQAGKLGYIDRVMGVHRVHEGGIWSNLGPLGAMEKSIKGMEIINPHLDEEARRINMMQYERDNCFLAFMYEKRGETAKARRHAWKAFRMDFRPVFAGWNKTMMLLRFFIPAVMKRLTPRLGFLNRWDNIENYQIWLKTR